MIRGCTDLYGGSLASVQCTELCDFAVILNRTSSKPPIEELKATKAQINHGHGPLISLSTQLPGILVSSSCSPVGFVIHSLTFLWFLINVYAFPSLLKLVILIKHEYVSWTWQWWFCGWGAGLPIRRSRGQIPVLLSFKSLRRKTSTWMNESDVSAMFRLSPVY